MATKNKTKKQEPSEIRLVDELQNLLNAIGEATEKTGFMYVDASSVTALVSGELIEVNPEIKDDAGNIAARITEKGKEKMTVAVVEHETPTETPVAVVSASSSSFALVSAVPIPGASRRGGRKESTYPFEKMEVGQSFFIQATEDKPEPWKQYNSTVSSATKRFAKPELDAEGKPVMRLKKTVKVGEDGKALLNEAGKKQYDVESVPKLVPTRQFVIRKVENGAPWGKPGVSGAGVWRTA